VSVKSKGGIIAEEAVDNQLKAELVDLNENYTESDNQALNFRAVNGDYPNNRSTSNIKRKLVLNSMYINSTPSISMRHSGTISGLFHHGVRIHVQSSFQYETLCQLERARSGVQVAP